MENTQSTSKTTKLKLDFKDSKYATGRRKTSIAKVWVKKGSGKIYVNGKLYSDYFVSSSVNSYYRRTINYNFIVVYNKGVSSS